MLRWFEHSQVYHPSRQMDASGAELGKPFEDVWFQAAYGTKLNGWFFPAEPNSARKHLAVLVCHGNAGNISHRLSWAELLLARGLNVFLFDYRGYGRSEGRPSEQGTYEDAQAAYRWLQQKGFAGTNIIILGESLGGAISTELALREPSAGLVLQSTFTCIPDIGAELFPWLPVRFLAKIKYDTCSKLPRINVPILIMHSRTDEIVRFHHGEKNFAAAKEPKLFWELNGSHNEAVEDAQQYGGGIDEFLKKLEQSRKGA